MKKHYSFFFSLFLVCAVVSKVCAQSYPPFNTIQYVDVANIRASALVHGDMWWKPDSGTAECEFPKGSGKYVGYNNNIWIVGSDAMGSLHAAVSGYRQTGLDYWPGPADLSTATPAQRYTTSAAWARIWKVSAADILAFRGQATHTAANTQADIWEWPAKGNANAKGTSALTINQPMAPFVDVNGNGTYEASAGDYPAIKGDQMLWWIINDNGPAHDTTNGTNHIGMDIAISAYAYNRASVLKNVIFYEYAISNRSSQTLFQARIGAITDLDIGYGFDDYAGFDSSKRMSIAYNGKLQDGNGTPTSYGAMPPAAGMVLLEMPGDSVDHYQPAGSFTGFTSGDVDNGDPKNTLQYNNLLHTLKTIGTTTSTNGSAYGPYVVTDYECVNGNKAGDRHLALATGDITLGAGTTVKVAYALVVADSANGCPNENFSGLKATADTAIKVYWRPLQPVATGVGSSSVAAAPLHIYPNPAGNILWVETGSADVQEARIYNMLGAELKLPMQYAGNKLSVATSALPGGIYTIRIMSREGISTAVFIRQ